MVGPKLQQSATGRSRSSNVPTLRPAQVETRLGQIDVVRPVALEAQVQGFASQAQAFGQASSFLQNVAESAIRAEEQRKKELKKQKKEDLAELRRRDEYLEKLAGLDPTLHQTAVLQGQTSQALESMAEMTPDANTFFQRSQSYIEETTKEMGEDVAQTILELFDQDRAPIYEEKTLQDLDRANQQQEEDVLSAIDSTERQIIKYANPKSSSEAVSLNSSIQRHIGLIRASSMSDFEKQYRIQRIQTKANEAAYFDSVINSPSPVREAVMIAQDSSLPLSTRQRALSLGSQLNAIKQQEITAAREAHERARAEAIAEIGKRTNRPPQNKTEYLETLDGLDQLIDTSEDLDEIQELQKERERYQERITKPLTDSNLSVLDKAENLVRRRYTINERGEREFLTIEEIVDEIESNPALSTDDRDRLVEEAQRVPQQIISSPQYQYLIDQSDIVFPLADEKPDDDAYLEKQRITNANIQLDNRLQKQFELRLQQEALTMEGATPERLQQAGTEILRQLQNEKQQQMAQIEAQIKQSRTTSTVELNSLSQEELREYRELLQDDDARPLRNAVDDIYVTNPSQLLEDYEAGKWDEDEYNKLKFLMKPILKGR